MISYSMLMRTLHVAGMVIALVTAVAVMVTALSVLRFTHTAQLAIKEVPHINVTIKWEADP